MQVKSEVFSRFASSVDFSSGEPLGGVEASTVGADLCVRPSSPERSLFCGRTRRSAPTQATSARQNPAIKCCIIPVSYTHLDVYKRQPSGCTSIKSLLTICATPLKCPGRCAPSIVSPRKMCIRDRHVTVQRELEATKHTRHHLSSYIIMVVKGPPLLRIPTDRKSVV